MDLSSQDDNAKKGADFKMNSSSPRMLRHIRDLLRLTGGKFENDLPEREPNNKENGLKIIRGAIFILVSFESL